MIVYLKDKRMDSQTLRRIENLLKLSDLIKFARYEADGPEHEEAMKRATDIIHRLKLKEEIDEV